MSNYIKTNIGNEGRVELHAALSLTGAEASINTLPAGANVPFIHSHKNNEEIYGIVAGKGKVIIDDENIELVAGDWLKISPADYFTTMIPVFAPAKTGHFQFEVR